MSHYTAHIQAAAKCTLAAYLMVCNWGMSGHSSTILFTFVGALATVKRESWLTHQLKPIALVPVLSKVQ